MSSIAIIYYWKKKDGLGQFPWNAVGMSRFVTSKQQHNNNFVRFLVNFHLFQNKRLVANRGVLQILEFFNHYFISVFLMTVMLDFNLDSLIFVSPVLFCFCALRHGIIPIVYSVVAYHRVKIFLLHCDTWMLLHVSSVAEIEATLVGSFVRSVLKGDDSVASPQLFL